MKKLNEYIAEGILDIEDNIENSSITIFKQLFLPITDKELDIKYDSGVLTISLTGRMRRRFLDIWSGHIQTPWFKYFKELHTIIFDCNVNFHVDVTDEKFCKNLKFLHETHFSNTTIIKGVNISITKYWHLNIGDFIEKIEDCSIYTVEEIGISEIRLGDLPEFKNVDTNFNGISIYNSFIPGDDNFSKIFNSMLDTSYTIKILDNQKKEFVDFNAKNIKQIIAKMNNNRRYKSTWGGNINGREIFKFKDGIDIKKEFGLDDFKNLKRIMVRNNNVGFEVLFDWIDDKTHKKTTYAGFYKR